MFEANEKRGLDMAARIKGSKFKQGVSTFRVPPGDWGEFLETFSRDHRGWLVHLETHDLITDEKVVSQETSLESIELDLEDEKNPRINVTVHLDNKVIKHVLFLPSQLVYASSKDGQESLQVETINTKTAVRFRAAVQG
jgi:hypothetical protein